MDQDSFILCLDQGTSSSRALVVGRRGEVLAMARTPVESSFPAPGWVEQDGESVWEGQLAVAREAMEKAAVQAGQVVALGITNQRETTLLWERSTGKLVAPAIVWQDRRTAKFCRDQREQAESMVSERTGLRLDPYFSATKLHWLLREHGLRGRAERGELAFGTMDSWLVWKLTGGRAHLTDVSNASRTMLMNLETLDWDETLLDWLDIPRALMPDIRGHDEVLGQSDPALLGSAVPIAAVLGDQQAALFGQGCHRPGQAKNTYGTGSFLLVNTGSQRIRSRNRLLSTVAWRRRGRTSFALEGSLFTVGAALDWLVDGMGVAESAADIDRLASQVIDSAGVVLVPAFSGLGAPHWDPGARALIGGLSRGVGREELCLAALEGVALQNRELICAFGEDLGQPLPSMRVDGGLAQSDLLLQLQADLADLVVERPARQELSALGAAYMAGLVAGFWQDSDSIEGLGGGVERFHPGMDEEERERLIARWEHGVKCSKGWS